MPVFETPYGTVDAPDLGAAQKWIARQKPAGGPQGAGTAPAATTQPPEQKDAPGGVLSALWSGLVHGAGNVLHGGARIGARMGAAPEIGQTEPSFSPERVKQVDETAAQREVTYQASPTRQAHPIASGIGEIGGEAAGAAAEMGPLAAGGAGASLPLRLAWNSLLGTGASLATPKGGESMEPAAQLKRGTAGAVGGLVGGAAGEAAGSVLGKAIAGNSPRAVDEAVTSRFRQVVKPGRGGQASASQLGTQDNRILTAVDQIIANRPNLKLTDPARGEVQGQLPRSLRQFSEAIDQTKRGIFEKYDALAKGAEGVESATPNRYITPKFEAAGQKAAAAQREVSRAEQAVTAAAAKQARAGNNVYMTSTANEERRAADAALQKARAGLERARGSKDATKSKLYGVSVDLAPAVRQLRSIARQPEVADFHPNLVAEAEKLAGNFESKGYYGLGEAQDVIQNLNRTLQGFYRNPTNETVSHAALLGPVVTALREGLDKAIEGAKGPGYQALRNQYGALRSIEKDVAGAVQREANKVPGGIGAIFSDIAASEEAIRGVVTLNPAALARAGGIKAAQRAMKYINDPNRAIDRLFSHRAGSMNAPAPGPARQAIGSAMGAAGPAGGIVGGEAGNAMDGLAGVRPHRPSVHDVTPPPSIR